ncbi:hypothetical protein [Confluentibacter sediminis]|uniref:hypothetical protein n=1 Tax=Confluentibacter sediminis TaxID=2219045 RepID=UPI000DAC0105|nr:hypothetical protein [Confluentibacter sediminis]
MKNIFKISYNAVFFLALLSLLTVNFYTAYSEDALFLNTFKAILIPCFLIVFFIKNKRLNLAFAAFLMFSFFGDFSTLFLLNDSNTNTSNIMYLFGYLVLIVISISKFKLADVDKVVGFYLLGILLINGYFLCTLCGILKAVIVDSTEMVLFGAKSMALIFLVFISFAVYLGKQTKASILFLIMSICFAFSDILNYVVHYYIYNWSILMIDRLLYVTGLFFAFKYVIETNNTERETYIRRNVREEAYSGDNIMA